MTTGLVPFSTEHLPAVREFSKRLWERPLTSDFFRWRYLECPGQLGLVAQRSGHCVATLWAVTREYRVGERRLPLLEPFDWYVRPELLHSGMGVRVMRRLMKRPEPMIIVGGTDLTRGFLPRLGWRESTAARSYLLPLAAETLAPRLERETRLPRFLSRAAATLLTRAWCRPQTRSAPFRATVEEVNDLSDEVVGLYDGQLGYTSVPIPSKEWHAWLVSGATGAGRFLTLQYRRSDTVIGWALGRVYTTARGCEAAVVEMYSPSPAVRVYDWMVSVLVQRLAEFAPTQIRARTTCPVLGQAFRQNHFLPGPAIPVFLWSREPFDLPEPVHLGGDIADSALIPYELPDEK